MADSEEKSLPLWVIRGKAIAELIKELETFSDKTLAVMISTDNGITRSPISLVMKSEGTCLLVNCEDTHRQRLRDGSER